MPFKVSEMQPFLRHEDGDTYRVEDVVKWLEQVTTAMREVSSIVVLRG